MASEQQNSGGAERGEEREEGEESTTAGLHLSIQGSSAAAKIQLAQVHSDPSIIVQQGNLDPGPPFSVRDSVRGRRLSSTQGAPDT